MIGPSQDLLELLDDLVSLEDLVIRRPLTLWRAWDQPDPRTSQRRVMKMLEVYRTLFLFGGNRSGKTELMRAILVALVLGSDHPDAWDFWAANGVNPDAFPRGPGKGWIIALRATDSLTYHRQQIVSLIPKWGPQHRDAEAGFNWYAWNMMGKDEARLQIMCPGYDEPAEILFKSDDPGPDTMQGDSCRAILHDEESRKHGSATFDEAGIRLIDQRGYHLMSNTPTRGRTWLWHEHVVTDLPHEGKVWIHAPDNPYLPRSELAKLEADPATAAIRLRGEFIALEGRVWPSFSRPVHVVPSFVIPEGSPRFRAIDFGTRHPFVCLWTAVLRRRVQLPDGRSIPDGVLVVYREHKRAEWTLAQHVEVIRAVEGKEAIEATWCDPEDPQQIMQLAHTHGMEVFRAIKTVTAGITCVAEYLDCRADGLPGLFVVDSCVETIREVESYCWGERGNSERPTGQEDHCCDALRYTCMGIRAWGA